MSTDVMRRLAAADPVTETPAIEHTERIRCLISEEPPSHEHSWDAQPAPQVRRRLRPLRALVIAVASLLALTAIALAAGGVILSGTPVRPEEVLSPGVGEGLPAPGGSRLLALRVADPEGGLPWGMRVVHTTRGEICLQLGRVQNGQLGALGVDGAFHNDGRFHLIPPDALPRDSFHGQLLDPSWGIANASTSCHLSGEASANHDVGLDRGSPPRAAGSNPSLRYLRDVSYGLLGPRAVSVTYHSGPTRHTVPAVPGLGAYLIVQRTRPGEQLGTSGGSMGTEGDLAPIAPLTAITYKLDGKLCERGPSLPPGGVSHLAKPCPWPRYPKGSSRTIVLNQPLRAALRIRGNVITAVTLSFTAPYAVSSARDEYLIEIPNNSCGGAGTGGSQIAVGHNVMKGATVIQVLDARGVFVRDCAPPAATRRSQLSIREVLVRTATLEVRYRRTGEAPVIVGSVRVHAPVGTHPAPSG